MDILSLCFCQVLSRSEYSIEFYMSLMNCVGGKTPISDHHASVYSILFVRWLNRPYFILIRSSVGICWFLNTRPNLQVVGSISVSLSQWLYRILLNHCTYNDWPVEPQIMHNIFETRSKASFPRMYLWINNNFSSTSHKKRLWQRKMP